MLKFQSSLRRLIKMTQPHSFSPPTSNYNPSQELVLIVDANNNPIGQATRQEMRQHNLIHRSTFNIIANSSNLIYVQKRTKTKDIFPGYYDPAPGGVILASEADDLLGVISISEHSKRA
jgi:hypothetical protein